MQEKTYHSNAAYYPNTGTSQGNTRIEQDFRHATQCPQPKEPDLRTVARELFGYLCELGLLQIQTRSGAFSPEPTEAAGNCDSPDDSLEATLRRSCRMAASLVGEARSINAKLIG